MGPLSVVDAIELVDLRLQLDECRGDGLIVEEPEQGLMEALVLSLRGRLVGLAGDWFDSEPGDVVDELADDPTSRGVQRDAVVGEESLRNTTCGDSLRDDVDRRIGGLTSGDVGCDSEAGVVVDELEDHALATTGENVLGRVQLPARVRRGIHEPPERRARSLLRLRPGNSRIAEHVSERRRRRSRYPHRGHLRVHADRPVIQH